MQITKIKAINYKCYKSQLELSLSKFNILIGKNGSGKSAIARLIPFILKGISEKRKNYIEFSPHGVEIGFDYRDVVFGHKQMTPMALGAEFMDGDRVISFLTTFVYSTELNNSLVTDFEIQLNGKDLLRVTLDLNVAFDAISPIYKNVNVNNNIKLDFFGLLPLNTGYDDVDVEIKKIRDMVLDVSYLGPFRDNIKRTYSKKMCAGDDVGVKGEFSPYVFQSKNVETKGLIQRNIMNWMQSKAFGKFYEISDFDKAFSIACNNGEIATNLIDEGMGLGQLFPVILNRFVREYNGVAGIEIIEQPELHMHPAACGAIADLYLETNEKNNAIFFVETHSKEFLLRVRRRIAEKSYNNEDVNIVFVDDNKFGSKVHSIKVNNNGNLSDWPVGIFEEDFEEVIAISQASRK